MGAPFLGTGFLLLRDGGVESQRVSSSWELGVGGSSNVDVPHLGSGAGRAQPSPGSPRTAPIPDKIW